MHETLFDMIEADVALTFGSTTDEQQRFFDPASAAKSARCRLWRAGLALWLAQAQLGPETGGHLNAAPRTNDSTPIASNQ